ncbi:hypothetical protein F4677DRAFT_424514 [Hypoxylon crocopeplum]|nr:hypothetical protein F4677DRAFT_424514 [Hypoxylon crocopeplum]
MLQGSIERGFPKSSGSIQDGVCALVQAIIIPYAWYPQVRRAAELSSICRTAFVQTVLEVLRNGPLPNQATPGGTGGTGGRKNGAGSGTSSQNPARALHRSNKEDRNSGRRQSKKSGGGPPGRQGGNGPSTLAQPQRAGRARQFACPFFVQDGREHWGCMTSTLNRVSDVRQHIQRKHVQKSHCPTCGMVFLNDLNRVELDQHIGARSCERRQFFFPGASGDQLDEMSRAGQQFNMGLTSEQRWYQIWHIMFPGIEPPASPYYYHRSGGVIHLVQRMVADYLQHPTIQQDLNSVLDQGRINITGAVLNGLSRFAVEWMEAPRLPTTASGSANLMTPSLNPSESLPRTTPGPSLSQSSSLNLARSQEGDYLLRYTQSTYQADPDPLDQIFNADMGDTLDANLYESFNDSISRTFEASPGENFYGPNDNWPTDSYSNMEGWPTQE